MTPWVKTRDTLLLLYGLITFGFGVQINPYKFMKKRPKKIKKKQSCLDIYILIIINIMADQREKNSSW